MTARRQHYTFAHRALPQIAAAHGDRFIEDMAGPHALPMLKQLWDDIGRERTGDAIASDGLAVSVQTLRDGATFALITMPEPTAPPEAYYVGVVGGRCFTLEYGLTAAGEPATFLCEWVGQKHVNFGLGPPPEEHAFVRAVELKR